MSITVHGQATLARGATPASTQAVPTGTFTSTGAPIYGAPSAANTLVGSAQSLLTKVSGSGGTSSSNVVAIVTQPVTGSNTARFVDPYTGGSYNSAFDDPNVIGQNKDGTFIYRSSVQSAATPNFSSSTGATMYVPPPSFGTDSAGSTPTQPLGNTSGLGVVLIGAVILAMVAK